jgi:DNA-directed RNA polymerase specialized sigma24 family protein
LTIPTEPFDELLHWLHPDRNVAGQKYESIRAGLIRVFASHGVSDAEAQVDETIDRVMKRLPEIRPTYEGDPARFFVGVARKIVLEDRRKREIPFDVMPERVAYPSDSSDMEDCLEQCLKLLPRDKRELILDYHLHQGRAKVELHREMAAELSISEGALRTRAHHLRVQLERCVLDCIEKVKGNKSAVRHHNK